MEKILNKNFIDMLSAFLEENVEFMIVGAVAMAFHGYVRTTGDIDFWIRISDENADRVWRALKQFGAPAFDLEKRDLITSGMVFQIGMPPNRIDIMNKIDGVEFEGSWPNRKIAVFGELKIPTIGKVELLINKRSTGRPKDQIDVLWLEKHPEVENDQIRD
ncbi:MAG: hypothetical protein ABIP78_12450 [Pyrinomonadaceae bacterium]